jgi:hypothetical protein
MYQYSETNVMYFLFNLLKELRASTCFEHYLLILRRCYTNDTWYIACVLCQFATPGLMQPTDITRTQYIKCRLCRASWGWASNAWNMLRPLIVNKLNKNASRWFHSTNILWCTVNKTLSLLACTYTMVGLINDMIVWAELMYQTIDMSIHKT